MSDEADDELIDEQIDFYRTDADSFDSWLGTLLDTANEESVAETYRDGRVRAAQMFSNEATTATQVATPELVAG